jgi:UDP-N-acetylenolpyruvoylglucosamine reductase
MHAFLSRLENEKIEYKSSVLLASISSFKVGGAADAVIYPDTEEKLCSSIELAIEYGVPYRVLGNTSNVLFSDNGFRGAIIITKKLSRIEFDGSTVSCGCGVMLPVLSERAAKHSLSGFEFACGIPGTLGGSVFMNAGAHGGAISDVLVSSRAYDITAQSILELDKCAHAFAYRHSTYMENQNLICLSASFALTPDKEETIRAKMQENMKDTFETVEEDYEFLDTVELDGETYFMLIPATDNEEIEGEVFIMKLVEVDGEEMLEGIDDGELFDKVYSVFKENNKDEFEFLD